MTFEGLNGETAAENFFLEKDFAKLKLDFRKKFNIHQDNLELFKDGKIIRNANEIIPGNHYHLSLDLNSKIDSLIQGINSQDPKKTIFLLQSTVKNPEFVQEFLKKGGFDVLLDRINSLNGNSLAYALNCLVFGLEYGSKLIWDYGFIDKLVGIVNDKKLANLSKAATKLLCFMIEDDGSRDKVVKILDNYNILPNLVERLKADSDFQLQSSTVRLICGIVGSIEDDLKRSTQIYDLDDLGFRNFLLKQIRSNQSSDLQVYIKEFETLIRREFRRRSLMKVQESNSLHVKAVDQILYKFQKSLNLPKLSWKDLGVNVSIHQNLMLLESF